MHTDSFDAGPMERALALRRLPAFETLPASDIELVAEQLRGRRFGRGELLMRPGVPLDMLSFVLHGSVALDELTGTPASRGPREVIGDIAALLRDAPAPRAIAEQETLTLELRRSQLQDVLEDEFPIFLAVLRSLADALVRDEKLALVEAPPTSSSSPFRAGIGPKLSLVERVLILRRTLDFAGTEIKPLFELARQATELSLPPRAPLWQTGGPANEFVIVVSGAVTVESEKTCAVFGPGSAVGALESLAARQRTHAAHTITAVRALKFDTAAALDLVEDNMAVGLGLLGVLARAIGQEGASARQSPPIALS